MVDFQVTLSKTAILFLGTGFDRENNFAEVYFLFLPF